MLVFIDKNGVRDSPLVDLFTMLSLCSIAVSVNGLSVWFTRIPSSSNPSDDPSREEPEKMFHNHWCLHVAQIYEYLETL